MSPLASPVADTGRANQRRLPDSLLAQRAKPPCARMPRYGPKVPPEIVANGLDATRGVPTGACTMGFGPPLAGCAECGISVSWFAPQAVSQSISRQEVRKK